MMNKKMARRAIAKIAQMEGIKESEVREEMGKAIMAGYMNEGTRGKWNDVFGEETIPFPEEFIVILGRILAK